MIRLSLLLAERADWLEHYEAKTGAVFVPTETPPPAEGAQVRIDLQFAEGTRLILYGVVAQRRSEVASESSSSRAVRDDVGVVVSINDREKINYVNGFVRGGMLDLREMRRLPLRLLVQFQAPNGAREGVTRDLNEEGLFVYTHGPLAIGTRVELVLSLPGGEKTAPLPCSVGYVMDEEAGGPGMGLRFELTGAARDTHNQRIQSLEREFVEGRLPDDVIA